MKLSFNALLVTLLLSVRAGPSAGTSEGLSRLVVGEDCSDIKTKKECKSPTNKKVCVWKKGKKKGKCKNVKVPNKDSPALHCYNLKKLDVSYEKIDKDYPCLRNYCKTLKTAGECGSDDNYEKGCGWCNGSCSPYVSYQEAYIKCVREAYKNYDPDRVNGKKIAQELSAPDYSETLFNGNVGPPLTGPGVPDDVSDNHRWFLSLAARPKGKRVPIHMHPFGGFTCIIEGSGISFFIEGEDDSTGLKKGDCYVMPPSRKMSGITEGEGTEGEYAYMDRDSFRTNICYPTWVVLEPKGYFVQDKEFNTSSNIVCCEPPDSSSVCQSE